MNPDYDGCAECGNVPAPNWVDNIGYVCDKHSDKYEQGQALMMKQLGIRLDEVG